MDKLQYDSFYKFLVSLGIVLIALPVVALVFITNNDSVLITQSEYDVLSALSQNSIQQREQIFNFVIRWLPLIAKIMIPAGTALILIGGIKWFQIQLQLDKQIKSETIIKEQTAKDMSASEIVERVADEVIENETASDTLQHNIPDPKSSMAKWLKIENACLEYFSNKYSRFFDYQQNIKVGKWSYDLLGVSKTADPDHLYEIKYWSHIPSDGLLESSIRRLEDSSINYESLTQRKCKCRFVIVIPDSEFDTVRMHCMMKLGEIQCHSKLEFISESDLSLKEG